MSAVYYCRQWFRYDKTPSDVLTEPQARRLYDARKLYTALIGDAKRPRCFVESNVDYIGVEFLDNHLREHVAFQFIETRPGMLFLSMAVYRKYKDSTDEVDSAVLYYFDERGATTVHKHFTDTNETWEAKVQLDVSPNWEPYPKFGEYDSITRLDRGLNLIGTSASGDADAALHV